MKAATCGPHDHRKCRLPSSRKNRRRPAWEDDSKFGNKEHCVSCTSFWRLRIPSFHSVHLTEFLTEHKRSTRIALRCCGLDWTPEYMALARTAKQPPLTASRPTVAMPCLISSGYCYRPTKCPASGPDEPSGKRRRGKGGACIPNRSCHFSQASRVNTPAGAFSSAVRNSSVGT